MDRRQTAQDKSERFDRITAAIAALEQQKKLIFATGQVAPKGCVVARYQVRQKQKVYWYYKLQALNCYFSQSGGCQSFEQVQTSWFMW